MQKVISTDQITLQYTVIGNGFPVIFIHGFGEDNHIWDNQLKFLSPFYKIIVPNLVGTGDSAYANKDTILSIESMAADLQFIIEQENITKCIMLGHSMGGYITLAFAEAFPQYLKGFGLIHSTAFADSEEKKKNRLKGIEVIGEYGGYAFLKNTIPNLFGTDFKESNPEAIAQLIEQSKQFSNKVLQQYTHAMMMRPDRTNVLKSTPLSVLLIAGTEDIAAPIDDIQTQSKLNKQIQLHVLEGVGHMGMLEATNQMNRLILQYLQENQ